MADEPLARLIVEVGADFSDYTSTLSEVVGKTEQIGTALSAAGAGITEGLTAPLNAVSVAAKEATTAIKEGFSEISSSTDAVGNKVEDLGATFKGAFSEIPQAAKDAGAAITSGLLEPLSEVSEAAATAGTDIKGSFDKIAGSTDSLVSSVGELGTEITTTFAGVGTAVEGVSTSLDGVSTSLAIVVTNAGAVDDALANIPKIADDATSGLEKMADAVDVVEEKLVTLGSEDWFAGKFAEGFSSAEAVAELDRLQAAGASMADSLVQDFGRVTQETEELSKDLSGVVQNILPPVNDLGEVFGALTTRLEENMATALEADAAYKELGGAFDSFAEELTKANVAAAEFGPGLEKINVATTGVKENLNEVAKSADNAKEHTTAFGTEFREVLEKLEGALGKLGVSSELVETTFSAISAAGLGVTAVFGVLAAAAVSASSEINGAFREIIIGTGAAGAELDSLKENFTNVFAGVDESAEETAQALIGVSRILELTGEPLEKMTKLFMELADITGQSVVPMIDQTTKAFNAWGIAAIEQGENLEFLYHTWQKTGVAVASLSGSLQQFGPQLRGLGLTFEQAAAMIGSLEKAGVPASAAMMGLRRGMDDLRKQGLDPSIDGFKQLVYYVKSATTELEAQNRARELFGPRGYLQIAEAIRKGNFELDTLVAKMKDGGKGILETSEQVQTLGKRLSEAWHQVEIALAPFGKVIKSALGDALTALEPLIAGIGAIGKAFAALDPTVQKVIVGLAAVAALAGPVSLAFTALGGQAVISGIASLASNVTALQFAFSGMEGPLTAAAARIVAFGPIALATGGALLYMYTQWDNFKKALSDIEALGTSLKAFGDSLFGNMDVRITEAALGLQYLKLQLTQLTLQNVVNLFPDSWGPSIQTLIDLFVKFRNAVGDFKEYLINLIPASVRNAFKSLEESIDTVGGKWVKFVANFTQYLTFPSLSNLNAALEKAKGLLDYLSGHNETLDKWTRDTLESKRPKPPEGALETTADKNKKHDEYANKKKADAEAAAAAAKELSEALGMLGAAPPKIEEIGEALDKVTLAFLKGKVSAEQYGMGIAGGIQKVSTAFTQFLEKMPALNANFSDTQAMNTYRIKLSDIITLFDKGKIGINEAITSIHNLQDEFGKATGAGGQMALTNLGIPSVEKLRLAADEAKRNADIVIADITRSVGEKWLAAQKEFEAANKLAVGGGDTRRTALKLLGIPSIEELENALKLATDEVSKLMADANATIGERYAAAQALFTKQQAVSQSKDVGAFVAKLLGIPDVAILQNAAEKAATEIEAVGKYVADRLNGMPESLTSVLLASSLAARNKIKAEADKFRASDATAQVLKLSGLPEPKTIPELTQAVHEASLAVFVAVAQGTADLPTLVALHNKETAARVAEAVKTDPVEAARVYSGLPTRTALDQGLRVARAELAEGLKDGNLSFVKQLDLERAVLEAELAAKTTDAEAETDQILTRLGVPDPRDIERLKIKMDQRAKLIAEAVKQGAVSLFYQASQAVKAAEEQAAKDAQDPKNVEAQARAFLNLPSLTVLDAQLKQAVQAAADVVKKNMGTLAELLSTDKIFEKSNAIAQQTDSTRGALKYLGIPSAQELEHTVEQVTGAFNKIKAAGNEMTTQGQKAWKEMVDANIAAGHELSAEVVAQYTNIESRMETIGQKQIKFAGEIKGEFDTAFDGLYSLMGKNLLEWGNWSDEIKNIGKQLAESLLTSFIKGFFKPLADQVSSAAAGMASSLAKSLGMFGGALPVGKGGGLVGTGAIPGGVAGGLDASLPGGAIPGVGKAPTAGSTGGALGSLGGVMNVVGLGVNIADAVIGAVQNAKMEKTLGLIEESTRYLKIGLVTQGDSLLNDSHYIRNLWTDFTKGGASFGDMTHLLMELTDEKDVSKQIRDYLYNPIGPNIAAILNALSGGVAAAPKVYGGLNGMPGEQRQGGDVEGVNTKYTQTYSGPSPGTDAVMNTLIKSWVDAGLSVAETLQKVSAAGFVVNDSLIAKVKELVLQHSNELLVLHSTSVNLGLIGSGISTVVQETTRQGDNLKHTGASLSEASRDTRISGNEVHKAAVIMEETGTTLGTTTEAVQEAGAAMDSTATTMADSSVSLSSASTDLASTGSDLATTSTQMMNNTSLLEISAKELVDSGLTIEQAAAILDASTVSMGNAADDLVIIGSDMTDATTHLDEASLSLEKAAEALDNAVKSLVKIMDSLDKTTGNLSKALVSVSLGSGMGPVPGLGLGGMSGGIPAVNPNATSQPPVTLSGTWSYPGQKTFPGMETVPVGTTQPPVNWWQILSGMPMMAEGGVTSGPTIAGEAGPEMVIPMRQFTALFGTLNEVLQELKLNTAAQRRTSTEVSLAAAGSRGGVTPGRPTNTMPTINIPFSPGQIDTGATRGIAYGGSLAQKVYQWLAADGLSETEIAQVFSRWSSTGLNVQELPGSKAVLTGDQYRALVGMMETIGMSQKQIVQWTAAMGYTSDRPGVPLGMPSNVPLSYLPALLKLESTKDQEKKGIISKIGLPASQAGGVAGILQSIYTPITQEAADRIAKTVVSTQASPEQLAATYKALIAGGYLPEDFDPNKTNYPAGVAPGPFVGGLASSYEEQQAFRSFQAFLTENAAMFTTGPATDREAADFNFKLQERINQAISEGLSPTNVSRLLGTVGFKMTGGGGGGGGAPLAQSPTNTMGAVVGTDYTRFPYDPTIGSDIASEMMTAFGNSNGQEMQRIADKYSAMGRGAEVVKMLSNMGATSASSGQTFEAGAIKTGQLYNIPGTSQTIESMPDVYSVPGAIAMLHEMGIDISGTDENTTYADLQKAFQAIEGVPMNSVLDEYMSFGKNILQPSAPQGQIARDTTNDNPQLDAETNERMRRMGLDPNTGYTEAQAMADTSKTKYRITQSMANAILGIYPDNGPWGQTEWINLTDAGSDIAAMDPRNAATIAEATARMKDQASIPWMTFPKDFSNAVPFSAADVTSGWDPLTYVPGPFGSPAPISSTSTNSTPYLKSIHIHDNTFRTREDIDYLMSVVQNQI